MTDHGRSAAVAASGLRPFGAEPQDASQAKPLVPDADDDLEAPMYVQDPLNGDNGTLSVHDRDLYRRADRLARIVCDELWGGEHAWETATDEQFNSLCMGVRKAIRGGQELARRTFRYASGTEAGTGETEGLDPKGDGPTLEEGDAQ